MLLHYGHERYVSEYWIPWNKYILIRINSANSGCHETASEQFWLWMLSFSLFFFCRISCWQYFLGVGKSMRKPCSQTIFSTNFSCGCAMSSGKCIVFRSEGRRWSFEKLKNKSYEFYERNLRLTVTPGLK